MTEQEIFEPGNPLSALSQPVKANDQSFSLDIGKYIMTARQVDKPRDERRIRQKLALLCAENHDAYVYSWEVNDRKNNRKVPIEGPTVKLAMDLIRTWGNCFAGPVSLQDLGTHWRITAMFVDAETGSCIPRDFLQRKYVEIGMRDADRQADIIFQIAQSKAIRNVVVNALQSEVRFMMEESKKRLLDWVENNRESANKKIEEMASQFNIGVERIESVLARKFDKWTVRDVAKVLKELRGIEEGMVHAEDLYPSIVKNGPGSEVQEPTKKRGRPARKPAEAGEERVGPMAGTIQGSGSLGEETEPAGQGKAEKDEF